MSSPITSSTSIHFQFKYTAMKDLNKLQRFTRPKIIFENQVEFSLSTLFVLGCPCRSFAKPPKQVQGVCECILTLRGHKESSWQAAKAMMSEANFLRSLMEMDCDAITNNQVSSVKSKSSSIGVKIRWKLCSFVFSLKWWAFILDSCLIYWFSFVFINQVPWKVYRPALRRCKASAGLAQECSSLWRLSLVTAMSPAQ